MSNGQIGHQIYDEYLPDGQCIVGFYPSGARQHDDGERDESHLPAQVALFAVPVMVVMMMVVMASATVLMSLGATSFLCGGVLCAACLAACIVHRTFGIPVVCHVKVPFLCPYSVQS